MEKFNFKTTQGQSLIELIIAVAVVAITVSATISALVLILRISQQDSSFQTASFLGQKVADGLNIIAERDWQQINSMSPDTDYRLATSVNSGDLIVQTGRKSTVIDGVVYNQFFRIADVSSGLRQAQIYVNWPFQGSVETSTISQYVARTKNISFVQNDWSGGATTPSDPVVVKTNKFLQASAGINFNSRPGAIKINTQ